MLEGNPTSTVCVLSTIAVLHHAPWRQIPDRDRMTKSSCKRLVLCWLGTAIMKISETWLMYIRFDGS